jgi:hypothetical protein
MRRRKGQVRCYFHLSTLDVISLQHHFLTISLSVACNLGPAIRLSRRFPPGYPSLRSRSRSHHLRILTPSTPATMLSLVLTVLFVHIAIHLVNSIGASTIDNLVCHQ